MKVKVDFYKTTTGKWYSGGEVDIGEAKLWREEKIEVPSILDESLSFEQEYNQVAVAISRNQKIMREGCCSSGDYFVVVQSLENDPEANIPGNFCQHLFFGSDFPKGS